MIKDQVKSTLFHKFSRPASQPTEFCTVAPSICEPLVWNLLHVSFWHPECLGGSWIFGKFVSLASYNKVL